jgi:AhpD family alkylhydroperoxidase
MKTFSNMARAAHGGEALDGKTKELVALAIAVATRCAPCIPYHAEGAVRQGASRAAVAETLATAVYKGAGPSVMYAAQALEAVDQITAKAAGSA